VIETIIYFNKSVNFEGTLFVLHKYEAFQQITNLAKKIQTGMCEEKKAFQQITNLAKKIPACAKKKNFSTNYKSCEKNPDRHVPRKKSEE